MSSPYLLFIFSSSTLSSPSPQTSLREYVKLGSHAGIPLAQYHHSILRLLQPGISKPDLSLIRSAAISGLRVAQLDYELRLLDRHLPLPLGWKRLIACTGDYNRSLEIFEQLAIDGDPEHQYHCGIHRLGHPYHFSPDFDKLGSFNGSEYLSRSAESGYPFALFTLALLNDNPNETLSLLMKASDAGHLLAHYQCAELLFGINRSAALRCAFAAEAEFLAIPKPHEDDEELSINDDDAWPPRLRTDEEDDAWPIELTAQEEEDWPMPQSEKEDSPARTRTKADELKKKLGFVSEEVFNLYKQAADEGDLKAQYKYAKILMEKNHSDGRFFMKRAANNGEKKAQFEYAAVLWEENELEKAEKYFRLAAKNGEKKAQLKYAEILWMDNNGKKAEKYFRLASENGVAEAQFRLGVILQEGKFGEKYQNEGRNWLKEAAENNHTKAIEMLKETEDQEAWPGT